MLCWPHSLVTKNSLGLSFKARHIVMICCLASAMSRTIALSCLTIKRLVESFVISRTVFVIVSMLAPVSGYLIQARLPIPSDRWRLLNRQSQFVWTYKCGSPRGLYPLPHQTTTPAQSPVQGRAGYLRGVTRTLPIGVSLCRASAGVVTNIPWALPSWG